MEKQIATLFDTSFFSEAPLDLVTYVMDLPGQKFITDRVFAEISEGHRQDPSHQVFSLLFDGKNRLLDKITIISLAPCTKSQSMPNFQQRNIFFKQNSALCSAYYHWLSAAVNPAIPTDPFRQMYNNVLNQIQKGAPLPQELGMVLANSRQIEIDGLIKMGFMEKGFFASILRQPRTKRLRDFKKRTLNLTDYQSIVAALLYLCLSRTSVLVATCDKDFGDIYDNVMRSAIEEYAINSLLTNKLGELDSHLLPYFRFLNMEEILDQVKSTFTRIRNENDNVCCGIHVAYFNKHDGKVYGPREKVPLWLMDFFLEYKQNLECYSLDKRIEFKYPIKYVMDPWKRPDKIYFDIRISEAPFYNGFMPNCEDRCKYVKEERENPLTLSKFV